MSIIHTTAQNAVPPFDYLLAMLRNPEAVKANRGVDAVELPPAGGPQAAARPRIAKKGAQPRIARVCRGSPSGNGVGEIQPSLAQAPYQAALTKSGSPAGTTRCFLLSCYRNLPPNAYSNCIIRF
jgi:hypothetical protein